MKTGVFILNYNRPDTTPKVVDSALHQSFKPAAIYILNNNPSVKVNYSGCININSQFNFRCIFRHAIALIRGFDSCLFVDDDVVLKPKTLENFISYSKKYPESILGYYGRNIVRPSLYSLDQSNFFTNQEKEVDIILGMIHFCKTSKLINSFILKKEIPDLPLTEDDIILSLGNKYIDKKKNYVIPYTDESGPIPIQSSKSSGLSHMGGHAGRRKDAVRRILQWAGELPKNLKEEKISQPNGYEEI